MEEAQANIVQALPAAVSIEDTMNHQWKRKIRSLQSKENQSLSTSPAISTSRCTRSQAAPEWTVQETLTLLGEIAAVDEKWLKVLSSYQRWKMISDNCTAMEVVRSSNQCKRKWETLLDDYRKIRKWNSRSGVDSYWSIPEEKRKKFGLPAAYEKEVFDAMDAVIQIEEDQVEPKTSDSDQLVDVALSEMPIADADSGPEVERLSSSPKRLEKALAMTTKLQQNAELVHSILRGELQDPAGPGSLKLDFAKPSAAETDFARRQAAELIKALGDLSDTLDQFAGIVNTGAGEVIVPVDP
ncbi:hypothetical protein AXF42_Ash007480 [Apostasia shenzhenica]|uniref:Myb-like domain-containing protein n=1 Tax=Apostasia shenzhenica TaxID=1088818 RepID=A0A2I0A5K7_9ASPA|nr:hypothetical protein AXF42_Ash007480 [Apostasia shenzhenica]